MKINGAELVSEDVDYKIEGGTIEISGKDGTIKPHSNNEEMLLNCLAALSIRCTDMQEAVTKANYKADTCILITGLTLAVSIVSWLYIFFV